MSSELKKYWEFSFDLNQEKLRNVYGRKNYTYAYTEIEKYLFRHGFSDKNEKQGSCYFTSEPMSYYKVDRIIRNIFHELPWLPECIEKEALSEHPPSYSYQKYILQCNKSKKHEKELQEYYKKIGIKPPLEVGLKFSKSKQIQKNKDSGPIEISDSRNH